tara:strand:+ start:565 stop:672 length:108 start_codon:yes stop_codon:yes gene_type:complete
MTKVKINDQQPHKVTPTGQGQIKVVKQTDQVRIIR